MPAWWRGRSRIRTVPCPSIRIFAERLAEHSEALFGGKVFEDAWGYRL